MAESIKIEVFRKKLPDELTKSLSEPDSRTDVGSGAALTAASAGAYFLRAAALTAGAKGSTERLDYMLRNGEILRGYMIQLIDEDVKCRGPLRRARKEGDARAIEAAHQPAVAIANEIVNMMGQCLELLKELKASAQGEALTFVKAAAELALSAIRASMHFCIDMSLECGDETYRYVTRRENELTLAQCLTVYEEILAEKAEA